MARAVELALGTESRGNLPVGAVIALDGKVIAEAANETFHPTAHPGRHAEVLALARIPNDLVGRLPEMTCYTTLEPCLMCFGSLVLHRVGRVVYGAADPLGGAVGLIPHLPAYVASQAIAIEWIGPASPSTCDLLWQRASAKYRHVMEQKGLGRE